METTPKKSKIIIYIYSHGEEIPDTPLTPNPNVRMLTYAGESCCLEVGFGDGPEKLNSIKESIKTFLRSSEPVTTYDILRHIGDSERSTYNKKALAFLKTTKQKMPSICLINDPFYIGEIDRTIKCLEENNNLQIISPVIDQKYNFYDHRRLLIPDTHIFGVYVLHIENPSEKNKLNVDEIIGEPLMKYKGKQRVWFDIDKLYKDIEKCAPEEIAFGSVVEIKEMLLSELLSYLIEENGFDIVNIIHSTCRRIPNFKEEVMENVKLKERELISSIDTSQGGKSKKRKTKRKTKKIKIRPNKILRRHHLNP